MRFLWIVGLALIGALVSAVQSFEFHALRAGTGGFTSSCSIGPFDCQAIDASRFAELFWGIPLSSLAMAAFLMIAVIGWMARNPFWRRDSLRALFLLLSISLIFAASYAAIQAFVLKKACLYCITVDAIIVTLFFIVLSLKPERLKPHRPNEAQWKAFGWIAALSMVFALIVQQTMRPMSAAGHSNVEEWVSALQQSPAFPIELGQSPVLGRASNAKVTIVKFSDFQCPSCKRGALLLHPLLKRYPDTLNIVFKHFPLDMQCNRALQRPGHPWACYAAKAIACFQQKGQFELAYQAFFEHQEKLNAEWIRSFAEQSGWNLEQFQTCIDSPSIAEQVRRDIEQGLALNVESTPTFFVNGHKHVGTMTMEGWTAVIEAFSAGKAP